MPTVNKIIEKLKVYGKVDEVVKDGVKLIKVDIR
jgi:hypothetical protein